jgi:hypothetical protein
MGALRGRYEVLERCNFACFYCGVPAQQGILQLQIEHVVPRAHGGTNDPWNLVAACAECNMGKGALMPTQQVIDRARDLYLTWAGTSDVAVCGHCGHVFRLEPDEEANHECWSCIGAWRRGYATGKGWS